jgi:hypothetical protein
MMTLWARKRVPRASCGLPLPTVLSPEAEAALSHSDPFPFLLSRKLSPSSPQITAVHVYLPSSSPAAGDLPRIDTAPIPTPHLSAPLPTPLCKLCCPPCANAVSSLPRSCDAPFLIAFLTVFFLLPRLAKLLPPGVSAACRRHELLKLICLDMVASYLTYITCVLFYFFAAVIDTFPSYLRLSPRCLLFPHVSRTLFIGLRLPYTASRYDPCLRF